MLKIDRMEIDEVGGNPARLAECVISQLRDLKPPVPVYAIAEALGIYDIQEKPLTTFEGALIANESKTEGAIIVNSKSPPKRRRYSVGHELGHYLNPWHAPRGPEGFKCKTKDMVASTYSKGDRYQQMEVEANVFAAELLLPTSLVRPFLNRKAGLDVDHIIALSDKFEVSKESAARRYVEFQDEPCAVVFSRNGVIRYISKSEDFPMLCVWNGDPLPDGAPSIRQNLAPGEISNWHAVDSAYWLTYPKKRTVVCEQAHGQSDGYSLSLIALEET